MLAQTRLVSIAIVEAGRQRMTSLKIEQVRQDLSDPASGRARRQANEVCDQCDWDQNYAHLLSSSGRERGWQIQSSIRFFRLCRTATSTSAPRWAAGSLQPS